MSKPKKIFLDNINEFRVIEDGPISYIYFIVCHVHKNQEWRNSVKIGFSHNPQQRLAQLQIGTPHDLSMWYFFPVDLFRVKDLEDKLHRKFRYSKKRGEWFTIHPCVREWISVHKEASIRFNGIKDKEKKTTILRKISY